MSQNTSSIWQRLTLRKVQMRLPLALSILVGTQVGIGLNVNKRAKPN